VIRALRIARDGLLIGLLALAVLLCLGYFVAAFIAFLWVALAGITIAGLR